MVLNRDVCSSRLPISNHQSMILSITFSNLLISFHSLFRKVSRLFSHSVFFFSTACSFALSASSAFLISSRSSMVRECCRMVACSAALSLKKSASHLVFSVSMDSLTLLISTRKPSASEFESLASFSYFLRVSLSQWHSLSLLAVSLRQPCRCFLYFSPSDFSSSSLALASSLKRQVSSLSRLFSFRRESVLIWDSEKLSLLQFSSFSSFSTFRCSFLSASSLSLSRAAILALRLAMSSWYSFSLALNSRSNLSISSCLAQRSSSRLSILVDSLSRRSEISSLSFWMRLVLSTEDWQTCCLRSSFWSLRDLFSWAVSCRLSTVQLYREWYSLKEDSFSISSLSCLFLSSSLLSRSSQDWWRRESSSIQVGSEAYPLALFLQFLEILFLEVHLALELLVRKMVQLVIVGI